MGGARAALARRGAVERVSEPLSFRASLGRRSTLFRACAPFWAVTKLVAGPRFVSSTLSSEVWTAGAVRAPRPSGGAPRAVSAMAACGDNKASKQVGILALLYNIIMRRRERRAPRRCVDRASTTRWRRARRYTLYDGAMTRCLCVRRSRVDAVGPADCPFCVDFCSACHVSPVFPISRFVPSGRETIVVFGWPPLFGCKGTRSLYAWGRREHGTQARLGIEAFAG